MADSMSIKIDVSKMVKQLDDISKATDRATMWTVRQAARDVRRGASAAAPRYRGRPRRRSIYSGDHEDMLPGDLAKSIKSDKMLKKIDGGYSVRVGPRGSAILYAAQQEKRSHYMQAGIDAGTRKVRANAEGAWSRAIKRASR